MTSPNPKVAFLQGQKSKQQSPSPNLVGVAASGISTDPMDPNWPDPKTLVDHNFVRTAASTRQRPQIESRAENKAFHQRVARTAARQIEMATHSVSERLEKQVTNTEEQIAEVVIEKKRFKRFGNGNSGRKSEGSKKPATRWTQALFAFVVLVILVAVLNGTFSVSSVMLDSTAFSGSVAKTITIALGFFLLPGMGLSIPFHLLRGYIRLAYLYLAFLVACGITFGFLFAVTWAHTYAIETGNQALLDLTMIGMGTEGDAEVAKPWLFENANWLTLLFQILADMCFAGAAKSYLSYLTWNYHLFGNRALQQDPEWQTLDRQLRDLQRQLAKLQAEKRKAAESLIDLKAAADDFAEVVSACADAAFLQEVDRFEQEEQQVKQKQDELRDREAALRQSQQELRDLLAATPGITRKPTTKKGP